MEGGGGGGGGGPAAEGGDASAADPALETHRSTREALERQLADTARRAVEVARAAVGSLQGRGIFGVELFELDDGSVTFNELAPRPHNSGHYTLDACATEQHEQHLRAVAGLPLGDTSLVCGGAAMLNIIGDGELSSTLKPVERALGVRGASVHWYGKAPPKPKRKMGHINVCSRSAAAAAAAVAAIEGEGESGACARVGCPCARVEATPTGHVRRASSSRPGRSRSGASSRARRSCTTRA